MDITTTRGLLAVVKHCLRLKPAGLLWGGNPCSNQVFMSSSIHGRTNDDPMGDQSLRSDWSDLASEVRLLNITNLMCSCAHRFSGVREANVVNTRFAILLFIATVRGVWSCVEQPLSSVYKNFPYLQHLNNLLGCIGKLPQWQEVSLTLGCTWRRRH